MSLFTSECEILIVCMLHYNYFHYATLPLNFSAVSIMISCKQRPQILSCIVILTACLLPHRLSVTQEGKTNIFKLVPVHSK